MGIGVIALVTSQKKEIAPQPGPPFTADSAHNGASIDTAGKVVLGNDVGDPLAPARLLNNREILTEDDIGHPFSITLNAFVTLARAILRGDRIQIVGDPFTNIQILCTGADDTVSTIEASAGDNSIASVIASVNEFSEARLECASGGTDAFRIRANGLGSIDFLIQGLFASQQINTSTICTKFQSNQGAAFNGATVQVSGTCTKRLFPESHGAGTTALDRDLDSAKVFRNSGALVLTLPNMIGVNFREGFYFDVLCNDASGVTLNAGVGTTIRFGDLATSVNGTISTTSVGAYMRIVIIDSTTYAAAFFIGAWSLT